MINASFMNYYKNQLIKVSHGVTYYGYVNHMFTYLEMNVTIIMINSTQVSYFTLVAYFDTGLFKYLFFLIVMSLYAFIICANVLLVVVICVNRSLHEPMYLFLVSLFVNELYGSTGLFPFLLVQILSDIHTVSAPFCFLQIFCVYTYGNVEFSNLAAMSYDRYLAICYPLQYHTRMPSNKVAVLIASIWLFGVINIVVLMSLSVSLQLCGNTIHKVYCDNYSIVKLACFDTTINNIYGLVYIFTVLFGLIILILYFYMRILKVCFSGSRQTRQKAVSTCTPQLCSLLNFTLGSFFEMVQGRFNMSSVPMILRIILSLYWLTSQPLFNPVMYGLKMSKIRNICRSLAFGKMM
ncbi:olfactory receptor 11A1-like [Etheostoma spectabile]|uniref:olfactory receptor 11A1-like n=1 Tax=Etheostoma spectabile TaxID=54343 RepID=UPI0013AE9CE5|nr:olfactory receptor 11A1-like [Etheostoma spectabile]